MNFSDLIRQIESSKNKGLEFEKFCKWFLENEPKWSNSISRIWFWDAWPNKWGPDCGIDLVVERTDSKLIAVQAKCYTGQNTVTKKDIDSFLSETSRKIFNSRLLIISNNNLSPNAARTIIGQEKPVKVLDRQYFESLDFRFQDYKIDLSHRSHSLDEDTYNNDIALLGNIEWILQKRRSRITLTDSEEKLAKIWDTVSNKKAKEQDSYELNEIWVFERANKSFIVKKSEDFMKLYDYYVPWDLNIETRFKKYGFTKRLATWDERITYQTTLSKNLC